MKIPKTDKLCAIGDIHGCYKQLKQLLPKLPKRKLIFLGDYIDRGKQSYEVVEQLMKLNAIFIRGNHEQMLLDYLNGINEDLFLLNGGYETIKSFKKNGKRGELFSKHHLQFFNKTLLYYRTPNYFFCHAGVGNKLLGNSKDIYLWIRDRFINSKKDWGKTVVFGHTPQRKPLFMSNKIGIDTGCVFGGKLTAIVLPEEDIIQV